MKETIEVRYKHSEYPNFEPEGGKLDDLSGLRELSKLLIKLIVTLMRKNINARQLMNLIFGQPSSERMIWINLYTLSDQDVFLLQWKVALIRKNG